MKRRVLYVDDDPLNLSLFELQFQKYFEIILCSESPKAIDMIRQESIELLLTDFQMPDMNGIELVAAVSELFPNLPCVMVSGCYHQDPSIDRGSLADYVSKPYDFGTMLAAITTAFEGHDGHLQETG